MSFVIDHVRRVDSHLDRLHYNHVPHAPLSPGFSATEASGDEREAPDLTRVLQLQLAIKTLSTTPSSRALLPSSNVLSILENSYYVVPSEANNHGENRRLPTTYEKELEWLLVSKATLQLYGLVLDGLLNQTIPLNSDIWYWDEVLGSYANTGLYYAQTSPWRLWSWGHEIYGEARRRLQNSVQAEHTGAISLSSSWKQFYGLVKDTIRDRSLANIQAKAISPLNLCQEEARSNRRQLKRFRERSACGLGLLLNEGLQFDIDDDGSLSNDSSDDQREEWKTVVCKSAALMESIVMNVASLDVGVGEFEDTVFTNVENDPGLSADAEDGRNVLNSENVAASLLHILSNIIPEQAESSKELTEKYGKPSRVVRYWLPATALLLSSSTILRIFINRKAEIMAWIRDLGATTIDFWYNWVVDPVKKVVGTIRHDKDSEIAIMSKESLEGDRASLERMVVDFAKDIPGLADSTPLGDVELQKVRAKVREGDLTPVLKAYEHDLRKPFLGTVRGNLIRALLIQIQKTKVDVEVAMSGIDALLKSQELVFGFVGLTPGVLVCFGVSRWLNGFVKGRRGGSRGKNHSQMIRVLRNIDRILSASNPSNNGMLSYKDHGLLLCEVHVLRQRAQRVLPGEINAEFLEEINDLVDIRTGVERQVRVVDRIRWAYGKWLQ